MKISIIGYGRVGSVIGKAWSTKGHEIFFGARDPQNPKVQAVIESIGSGAKAGTVKEAVDFSNIVFLTVPWEAAQETVEGIDDWNGKILVDCTNPVKPDLTDLSIGHTTSAGEQVASWAKGAKVVKTLNTTGAPNMANPYFGDQAASMFYCGDDQESKGVVKGLLEDLGFEAVDVGPLVESRFLEAMAMLWIRRAIIHGKGTNFAFKLLTR